MSITLKLQESRLQKNTKLIPKDGDENIQTPMFLMECTP